MRHGTAGRRQRNRGHGHGGGNNNNGGNRRGNGPNRMQVFDSNGPEVRIRGTAHQVVEKYLTLAKDAASAGDRVLSESYMQHAEHYQRIINSFEEHVQGAPSNFPFQSQDRAPESFTPPQRQDASPDLALPASILGSAPKQESKENTRTSELTNS